MGLCLLALLAAVRVATGVFDRLPHLEDEVAYLFQAKTIASGRLTATAPPRPEFFSMPFIIVRDGQWFGKYPPGYPAVLALGVLVGQPWLLNPLVAALCVWLVYLVGSHLYGAPTGLLAAALLLASPFFLLQAGSFLAHVVSLFWALTFLRLFALAQWPSTIVPILAGGTLGMLFLSRPLTAVGIALPYVLWAGVGILRVRQRVLGYVLMLLGVLPFVLGLLAYNRLTTGDPLRSAYELYWPDDKIGFGEGISPAGYYTLADGWRNARGTLKLLADYLFGWPQRLSLVPAVLASALASARLAWHGAHWAARAGKGESRARRGAGERHAASPPAAWDLLQAGVVVSLVAVHLAYWYPGHQYGPRYYFEALGALVLLSARGLLQVAELAALLLGRALPAWRHSRAGATAAVLLVVAGLVLHSVGHFAPQEFRRYTRWYNIDGAGVRQVRAAKLEHAVVFVSQAYWTDYAPFFCENVPSLDAAVVYAADLGDDANRELLAHYPGRTFFRYADGRLVPLPSP